MTHILIIEDSEMTILKLKAMLNRLGFSVTAQSHPVEALKWLTDPANKPDIIISDVEMPDMNGYAFIRQARTIPKLKNVPMILLTGHTEISDKMAGFEAGADDYISKSVTLTELELRIKALLARTVSTEINTLEVQTKVISVFSLRGGTGVTSLAVNLAVALAQTHNVDIPLLDMAVNTGHCALMLNQKPKNSLATLAKWSDNSIDYETVKKLFLNHPSGVKLLPAPLTPIEAELVTPETINLIWNHLKGNYAYLVVDAGSQLTEATLTVLERSDMILLMLTPEIASMKSTVDALSVFEALGYPREYVQPVLNWTFPKGGVGQKDIEALLSKKLAAVIPYDSELFIQAINVGKPFSWAHPKSNPSVVIHNLAHQITSAGKVAQPSKSSLVTPNKLSNLVTAV